MTTTLITPELLDSKLIISGLHLDLTEAIKQVVRDKVSRLLRHEPRIVRVRIDIEHDKTRRPDNNFIAKGHIEIGGPDILASVASEDAYKSIDTLIDKLDGALRRRHSELKEKRHHPHPVDVGGDLPKAV